MSRIRLYDIYGKNRFWSPILILHVFKSYHSPHAVYMLDSYWPLSHTCLDPYPDSTSIPVPHPSWSYPNPDLIAVQYNKDFIFVKPKKWIQSKLVVKKWGEILLSYSRSHYTRLQFPLDQSISHRSFSGINFSRNQMYREQIERTDG